MHRACLLAAIETDGTGAGNKVPVLGGALLTALGPFAIDVRFAPMADIETQEYAWPAMLGLNA